MRTDSFARRTRYLKAMAAAANFAWTNRQCIAHSARGAFKRIFGVETDQCRSFMTLRTTLQSWKRVTATGLDSGCSSIGRVPHALFPASPFSSPGSMGTASYFLLGQEGSIDSSARIRTPGHSLNTRSASVATGPRSCSQLSNTNNSSLDRSNRRCSPPTTFRGVGDSQCCRHHLAHRLVIRRDRELAEPRTIPRNRGNTSAATCSARRVFADATRPGQGDHAPIVQRVAIPASSSSRPTNDVNCSGRFPGNASSDGNGGNPRRRSGWVTWNNRTGLPDPGSRCYRPGR